MIWQHGFKSAYLFKNSPCGWMKNIIVLCYNIKTRFDWAHNKQSEQGPFGQWRFFRGFIEHIIPLSLGGNNPHCLHLDILFFELWNKIGQCIMIVFRFSSSMVERVDLGPAIQCLPLVPPPRPQQTYDY